MDPIQDRSISQVTKPLKNKQSFFNFKRHTLKFLIKNPSVELALGPTSYFRDSPLQVLTDADS